MPRWLPNALTGLRIALIPAFLAHAAWCARSVAAGDGDEPHRTLAAAALLAIGLTDVADGWIARRYRLETPLGAALDAIADKLAQFSVLLFFFFSDGGAFLKVPLWFVALILGRDVVLGLGTLAVHLGRGRVAVVHEGHGRIASLLLFVLLVWVTLDGPRAAVPPALVAIAVVVVVSTADYVRDGWRQWREVAPAG